MKHGILLMPVNKGVQLPPLGNRRIVADVRHQPRVLFRIVQIQLGIVEGSGQHMIAQFPFLASGGTHFDLFGRNGPKVLGVHRVFVYNPFQPDYRRIERFPV